MSGEGQRRVLALVADLMDRSRLNAAAAESTTVICKAPTAPAASTVDLEGVDLVIVDLARPTALAAIEALRPRTTARIVAYGPHVDRERLAAAEAAGSDDVLARSAFVARLGGLLGDPAQPR